MGCITWGSSAGSCLSVSITSWDIPVGKAWLEKWAFLLLQIHSLNTQLIFSGWIPRDFLGLLTSKGSKAKPRLGHPTKTGTSGSSLFSQGSNSVGSTSQIPVFQGNFSAPARDWVSSGDISPAGSGALEVLVPVFSGWPAGRGTSPPGYPQCGAVYQAEEALVSASLDSFQWGCQSPLS